MCEGGDRGCLLSADTEDASTYARLYVCMHACMFAGFRHLSLCMGTCLCAGFSMPLSSCFEPAVPVKGTEFSSANRCKGMRAQHEMGHCFETDYHHLQRGQFTDSGSGHPSLTRLFILSTVCHSSGSGSTAGSTCTKPPRSILDFFWLWAFYP